MSGASVMIIEFDRPMLDWLTLTSYRDKLAQRGTAVLAGMPDPFARKVICYDGLAADGVDGGCFVGTGEQNGRYHCMLQLSGALADRLGPMLIGGHEVGEGVGNISRIDLQVTIPEQLDLDALAAALVGKIRSQVTIYRTLQGGQVGDTLYIGSPKSDKRIRIYHKAGGTRCEVQYRRDYAASVAAMIKDTGCWTVQNILAGLLRGELRDIYDASWDAAKIIEPIITVLEAWHDGYSERPESNGRAVGDTERWLRRTVMDAMIRECRINENLRTEIIARLHGCNRETGEIFDAQIISQ
jgi:hypothetical protein